MFEKNHHVLSVVESRLLSNKDGGRELKSYYNNPDKREYLLELRWQ